MPRAPCQQPPGQATVALGLEQKRPVLHSQYRPVATWKQASVPANGIAARQRPTPIAMGSPPPPAIRGCTVARGLYPGDDRYDGAFSWGNVGHWWLVASRVESNNVVLP